MKKVGSMQWEAIMSNRLVILVARNDDATFLHNKPHLRKKGEKKVNEKLQNIGSNERS